MKRYLTVGIIFGILVIVGVAISWIAFPAWKDPASGGFWTLLSITVFGVFSFVRDMISIWKDLEEEKKEEPKPIPAPLQSVQSQHADSILNAPGGTINVYPQTTTQTPDVSPLKPNTPKGWFFGHRYGDLESFTGRADELKLLDEWLANKTESLLIFNAFGGFGKSALTWHWLNNHVEKNIWSIAIWWSFYEKESGFDSFLSEALTHLGIETKERSSRQQVNDLLDVMQNTGLLIVLDGFERLLRQYGRMDAALQEDDEDAEVDPSQRDCTSQSAETFLRGLSDKKITSKVLMTSRLLPRVMEGRDGKLQKGCREVNLKGFSPDDAVTYFQKEGIKKATRAEIIEVCSAYGYHPLSLSLLVGWINREDGNEHQGDIVEAKNLNIFDNIKARRNHVLERAYGSLAPERRDLLSKISCLRGSMEYAVLTQVFPSPDLDKALLDLRKRGLLQYMGETQRYDMHPIVRHYTYKDFYNKKRIHQNLAKHFRKELEKDNPTWYRFLPVSWRDFLMLLKPKKVQSLGNLAPVIELYHHMVRAGNLDEAMDLFYNRIVRQVYFQFGAYQLCIELMHALFLDGEDKLPHLKRKGAQAWALNTLANVYAMIGQPRRAFPLFEMHNAICGKAGDKKNLAIGLGNLAIQQSRIGALSEAERNTRQRIALHREIASFGHNELGRTLTYLGQWDNSERELSTAIALYEKTSDIQGQGLVFAHRSLRFLLMAREAVNSNQSQFEYLKSAIECAQRALEFADEDARTVSPTPRDFIDAHWLLGSAYCANWVSTGSTTELTLAEENLSKALNLCRQINLVTEEADILLNIARLRYAQGDFKDAQEKASEALMITERSGYVLQGADVNLFLAQYALEQEKDNAKAKEYAEEAKKLATCDGPPYYYKVAYEEAEAMLERLNERG